MRYRLGDCTSAPVEIKVKVFDSTKIFVPTAFTPNGDGVNDTWRIIVQGKLNNIACSVFIRRGTRVFAGN